MKKIFALSILISLFALPASASISLTATDINFNSGAQEISCNDADNVVIIDRFPPFNPGYVVSNCPASISFETLFEFSSYTDEADFIANSGFDFGSYNIYELNEDTWDTETTLCGDGSAGNLWSAECATLAVSTASFTLSAISSAGSILTVGSAGDLFAAVGTLVNDLWVLLAIAIGVPLAFYIIRQVIFVVYYNPDNK